MKLTGGTYKMNYFGQLKWHVRLNPELTVPLFDLAYPCKLGRIKIILTNNLSGFHDYITFHHSNYKWQYMLFVALHSTVKGRAVLIRNSNVELL